MVKKLEGQMPRVEELTEEQLNAIAPILVVPAAAGEEDSRLGQKSIVPGQGVVRSKPVDDEDALAAATVEDLEDDEGEKDVDYFALVIDKLARTESPSIRTAMRETDCFARLWYDCSDKSYCPETECHLRDRCEKAYHKAIEAFEEGFYLAEELAALSEEDHSKIKQKVAVEEESIQQDDFSKIKQKRKLQKKKVVKEVSGVKRARKPYVDLGRPVDRFVKSLWNGLGAPPQLPDNWIYWSTGTRDQRSHGQKRFVDKYGAGMQVSRRAGYHSYFYDGMHVCRIWVNAAGGAWCDVNPWLANKLKEIGERVEITPKKDKKHSFNFYPLRFKIERDEQVVALVHCIQDILSNIEVR